MKILAASLINPALKGSAKGAMRIMQRDAQSEAGSANVTVAAILALSNTATSLRGSTASFEIDGLQGTFNNSNGTLTIDKKKIDLKKVGLNTRTTKGLILQVDNSDSKDVKINVFKEGESTGYQFSLNGRNWKPDADNKFDPTAGTHVSGKASLFINNDQAAITGTGSNDVIINRKADTNVAAGAGDDVIFNFANSAGTLDGGAGADAIYSVGISKGALKTGGSGGGTDYIKLTGNMTGGSIELGSGRNVLDASGKTLNPTSITDAGGTSSAVIAKTIGGTMSLTAGEVAVDVGTLNANLTLGAGRNSLVADTLKNNQVTSSGADTFLFKTLDNATVDASGSSTSSLIKVTGSAKKSTFKLGTGTNTLDATGKTLTSTEISGGGSNAINAIKAGSITGAGSKITLTGNTDAGEGTGIAVSGAINNTEINITGLAEITAKSLKDSTLTLAGAGDKLVDILGSMTNTKVAASGSDALEVKVKSSFSGSSLESSVKTTFSAGAVKAGANDKISLTGNFANTVTLGSYTGTKSDVSTYKNITMSGAAEQSLTIKGAAKYAYFQGSNNGNKVTVEGSVSDSSFDLGSGSADNSFKAVKNNKVQSLKNVSITATTSGSTTVEAGAYSATAGGYKIELLGAGSHEVSLTSISGKGSASGADALSMTLGASTSTAAQKLSVAGSVKNLKYSGNDGQETISINGSVTGSSFSLGAGDDVFLAEKGSKAQALKNTSITSTGGSTSVKAGTYSASEAGHKIELGGAGKNTLELGSVSGKSATDKLEILLGANAATTEQTLKVNGSVKNLDFTGSDAQEVISIAGSVTASSFSLGAGNDEFKAEKGGKDQALKNTSITSTGGNTSVKAGTYSANEAGHKIQLGGAGKNSLELGSISGKSATDKLEILLGANAATAEQTLKVNGSVKNLDFTGSDAQEKISVAGSVTEASFSLGGGNDEFTAVKNNKGQALKNTDIVSTGGDTKVTAGAYTSSVATKAYEIALGGAGENSLTLSSISGKSGAGKLKVSMGADSSSETQTLSVNGAVKNLDFTGSNAKEKIEILGSVSESTFALKGGNDEFTAEKGGKGQALKNTSITSTAGNTTVTAGAYSGSGANEISLLGAGVNTLKLGSVSGKSNKSAADRAVIKLEGTASLEVGGSVKNLNYTGGAGDDKIKIIGSSVTNSTFLLGDGDNLFQAGKEYDNTGRLTAKGASINGVKIEAGSGEDEIIVGSAKNYEFNLGSGNDRGTHFVK